MTTDILLQLALILFNGVVAMSETDRRQLATRTARVARHHGGAAHRSLGELVPERLALTRPEAIARLIARPMASEPGEEPAIVRREGGSWRLDGALDLDTVLRALDAESLRSSRGPIVEAPSQGSVHADQ